jgi:hypothetical protein
MEAFHPVPRRARPAILRAYRSYLHARDGVVDATARTLSRREPTMQRFAAPGDRWMDREVFERQYARFDARRATSPETLLLLALVKVNAAEAYGVHRVIDGALARARRSDDDTELVLLVEESYHTRILRSAAQVYGLDVPPPSRPHVALRALVSTIATLPPFLARPLTLAGEMMGVLVFLKLLDAARTILHGAPAVRDAIEERLIEILIDEIGHVSFQRLAMGRAGLALTRVLLPIVARGLSRSIPEVRALGAIPRAPVEGIAAALAPHGLPETVRRNAFFA